LLLDDEAAMLRSLSRAFRASGAKVVAYDAPEPIFERLDAELPHVMVIDYMLGSTMSGGDVARELRRLLRHSCPPLVLLSGTLEQVRDEDLARFDHAISKATDSKTIIHQVLARAAREQATRSETMPRPRGELLGEIGRDSTRDRGEGTNGPC